MDWTLDTLAIKLRDEHDDHDHGGDDHGDDHGDGGDGDGGDGDGGDGGDEDVAECFKWCHVIPGESVIWLPEFPGALLAPVLIATLRQSEGGQWLFWSQSKKTFH